MYRPTSGSCVQAKEQDYSETLAFVRLLNQLWKSSASLPEYGRSYAHFTYFVLNDVLGSLHQRAYRCALSALKTCPLVPISEDRRQLHAAAAIPALGGLSI